MLRSGLIFLFTVAILIVLSCNNDKPTNVEVNSINSAPAQTPLPAATIDELASGRKVFATNCANCHKDNGTGGEVVIEGKKLNPDDLTSAKIKGFADEKILRYIMNGVEDEGMPAFKGKLSEGEMRDVLKFIRVELQKMPAQSPKADPFAKPFSTN